jgi:hypothetical protein
VKRNFFTVADSADRLSCARAWLRPIHRLNA